MAFTAAQRQDNLWDSPRASRGPGRGLGRWRAGASGHREAGHAHGLNTPAALRHAWPGVRAAPAPPLKPRGALLQGGPDHLTGSLSIRLWQLAAALPGGRHRPSPSPGEGDVLPALPWGPSLLPLPLPPSTLLLDTQGTQATLSFPFFPQPAPFWSCRRAGRKEPVGGQPTGVGTAQAPTLVPQGPRPESSRSQVRLGLGQGKSGQDAGSWEEATWGGGEGGRGCLGGKRV